MTQIARMQISKVVKPMKTTFATSLGSKTCATSVIIKITLTDGSTGLGEVPTSFVFPNETAEKIKTILSHLRLLALGFEIEDYKWLADHAKLDYPDFHMTCSGFEVALFRAWLATNGKKEFSHWGAKKTTIETDITIPFVPKPRALDIWLQNSTDTNFRIYKIKVSGRVDEDIAFLKTIYAFLIKHIDTPVIRLDGNQGYTAKTCLDMLKKCRKSDIAVELFEQPLKRDDYKGLASLRGKTEIPIIVDETVFDLADCRRVIDNDLADGINIKIAKSGIDHSAKIYTLAKRAGLKLMLGCMTETMTGLSAAINFAAGKGGFDYIDLDSIHFFAHANRYEDIAILGPAYQIRNAR